MPWLYALRLMNTMLLLQCLSVTSRRCAFAPLPSVIRRASTTKSSLFATPKNKNLLSLEECLSLQHNALPPQEETRVVFVDGSWYHKGNRTGRDEFEAGPRIQGARYLDILDVATTRELFPEANPKGLRAMLPPKDLFAAAMDAFDIRNSDHVIVYGRQDALFTPRVWFLFHIMGHERVSLMQASLEDWIEAGGNVETNVVKRVPWANDFYPSKNEINYEVNRLDSLPVVDMQQLLSTLTDDGAIILDSRGSTFNTQGHIPGAIHIPYSSLTEADKPFKLKSKEELEQVFNEAGVDVATPKRIICSCGSGVSVCHLYLALEECGRMADAATTGGGETLIYDGSWQEWGSDPTTPKST